MKYHIAQNLKSKSFHTASAALFLAVSQLSPAAFAADQFFSTAGGTIWDAATTAAWSTSSNGSYTNKWTSGNTAIFEGAAGAVTVGSGAASPKISGMTFNVTGYTLSGGQITLGANTTINSLVSSTTIGSVIGQDATTRNLQLTGSSRDTSTITLGGANTYAGNTTLSTVTVSFNSLANSGSASSFGTTGNIITGGNASATALVYTGGAASTNRAFLLGGTANGGGTSISNNGSGAISLNSSATTTTAGTAGNRALTLAGTNTDANTFGQILTDMAGFKTSLTKSNSGTWVLTGNNTYTGNTTVSAGTLAVSGSGTLGTNAALTLSGGSLDLGTTSQTVGAVTLSSATGSGTLSNGTLTGSSYTVSNTSGNYTVSANLAGTGSLSKSGGGTLTLSGNNTYSSATSVSGGVLKLASSNALSANSNLQLSSGVIGLASGDFTLSNGTGAGQYQVASGQSAGWAAYGADRTVTVATSKTDSAAVSISLVTGSTFGGGMRLSASDADATVTVTNAINLNSGGRTITVNDGSAAVDAVLSGAISATSTTGTLTVTGGGTLALTGASTYTGSTTINGGMLQIGNGGTTGSLATGSAITNNATLAFKRSDALTVGNTISGTGAVNQLGTGTTTLTGGNSYSGLTTVASGSLIAGNSTAFNLATGQVNITGGTLDSSVAATSFGGSINLSSGAVNINTNSAVGAFTLAAGKNFTASGGTLTFNLGTAFDQIISGGGAAKFDLSGSTLALDTTGLGFSFGNTYQLFSGFNASTSVVGTALITGYDTVGFTATLSNTGLLAFTANPSAVPEPSTYAALAGLGVLFLAAYRRRAA